MSKFQIIDAIEKRVMSFNPVKYSVWTIGITNNPERRKEEHKNNSKEVKWWMHWKTDSEADARDIEKHFVDKGMKGDIGGGDKPIYIYIF